MADQEDEESKMGSRQSTPQHESPEPKRSKPWEDSGAGGEATGRLTQRELMAAAAERRMAAAAVKNAGSATVVKTAEKRLLVAETVPVAVENVESVKIRGLEGDESKGKGAILENVQRGSRIPDTSLSLLEADELFLLIFGNRVSKDILAQWSNQGIRFSSDPETSMGLVQHEGGPCGVLAAIQLICRKEVADKLETIEKMNGEKNKNLAPAICKLAPARTNLRPQVWPQVDRKEEIGDQKEIVRPQESNMRPNLRPQVRPCARKLILAPASLDAQANRGELREQFLELNVGPIKDDMKKEKSNFWLEEKYRARN